MSTTRPSVSKPLLATFVAVVLLGAGYFAYNAMSGTPEENLNVPKKPDNLGPVPKEEMTGPQPMGFKGG